MVSTVALVELGDQPDRPEVRAVFGTATDPRPGACAVRTPLRQVGLDPVSDPPAPLHVEDENAPRLPADILPVGESFSFEHEIDVTPGSGKFSRVTLPGAGPVEPYAVSWSGVARAECTPGGNDECWMWDRAARAVLVPTVVASGAKISFRGWRRPLIIAVDAMPAAGLRFYSASH
jgi:hypothetical protein